MQQNKDEARPCDGSRANTTDWYAKRSELLPSQVFLTRDKEVVRLVCPVEGDATKWVVDDWIGHWSCEGSEIECSDLYGQPIRDDAPAISRVSRILCKQREC